MEVSFGSYGYSTALLEAARRGQPDIGEYLLDRGASAKAENGDSSPLFWASQNRDITLVQKLLDHGADPNVVTHWEGDTPLSTAAQNGQTEIVKLLIAHGAKVDVRDKQGNSLLKMAAGHPDIVQILKQAGATE